LLLILIGALFLVNNIWPELVSFEAIARYWPFVLIGWGLIRLVEILFWWLTSKPLPRHGLSGGEWVLVVFVCLIGSGLFVAHRYGPRLPSVVFRGRGVDLFGEAHDFQFSEKKPAVNVTRVVVENLRGNTRIVGADTQEVKAGGRKTIRAYNQSDADRANERTPVEIVTQGEQILVRTNQEAISGERTRVSTDLELIVPRSVSIQADGRSGNFDVVNVDGSVEINSSHAAARLQDIGGSARIDLRKSDLVRAINVKGRVEILGRGRDVELENISGEVVINGYYSGDLQCRNLAKPILFQSGQTELKVEQVPGRLHMDLSNFLAANIVGPIRLTARNRDVLIEDFANALKLSIERGDVDLRPGRAPTAEIEAAITRLGDVELTLPTVARFELTASTERGKVTNEFGPALEAQAEGRGASLNGSVGKGPKINITTERGSITVRKE
jgi:hypothetical protein